MTEIAPGIWEFEGNWTRDDFVEHSDKIFVFGDNVMRRGNGGQAIARPFPNSVGIRTKHRPGTSDECYFSDIDFHKNKELIRHDFRQLAILLKEGKHIVLSKNGYGNGLAQLPERAIFTYLYLIGCTNDLVRWRNGGVILRRTTEAQPVVEVEKERVFRIEVPTPTLEDLVDNADPFVEEDPAEQLSLF